MQSLTDDKGKRTAAVIDIEDVLVPKSRRHERRIPFEKVKALAESAEERQVNGSDCQQTVAHALLRAAFTRV